MGTAEGESVARQRGDDRENRPPKNGGPIAIPAAKCLGEGQSAPIANVAG